MKLKLDEKTLALIDAEYDIMAINADPEVIEKSKRGQGHQNIIRSLADDILDHLSTTAPIC